MVELAARLVHLLAQEVECGGNFCARFVGIKLNVITDAVRREKTVDRAGGEQLFGDDFVQQFLRILEQFPGFWIVQNRRITAAQFPSVEKWGPVNERRKFLQRKIV